MRTKLGSAIGAFVGGRAAWTVVLLAGLASSCGGATVQGSTEAATSERSPEGHELDAPPDVHATGATATMAISGPERPWESMDEPDREKHMVEKVLPTMQGLFAEHDETHYGSGLFDCETCHGKEMEEIMYVMPTPSLFALPEPGSRDWNEMENGWPDKVRFMKETVTPTMGKLLGIEGFTCFNCHPAR